MVQPKFNYHNAQDFSAKKLVSSITYAHTNPTSNTYSGSLTFSRFKQARQNESESPD
uniref:Uncharacterized protein n=1 Tax=Arion vulgaris TaxID=1028688 RepID=A0A0B6ZF71_9EUPU